MNRSYWDRISKDYQHEVLSVYDNDLNGTVEEKIAAAALAYPEGRAADLGCGIGRFIPSLADTFNEVEACDYTRVGLKKAKSRCRSRRNVRFHQVDLVRDCVPFEPVECALCVNVLIMPSLDKRMRAWRAVSNQVAAGGTLLLVVPSYESAQMEFFRAVESRLSRGEKSAAAIRKSVDEQATVADMRMGVLQLDGVRTKHYFKEEVELMIEERGFDLIETLKVEYAQEISGTAVSSWDWMVVAKRRVPPLSYFRCRTMW